MINIIKKFCLSTTVKWVNQLDFDPSKIVFEVIETEKIEDQKHLKQSVYKALYTIAKEHGVTVLAEGVETLEELETVKSLGVDLVQGYYFAKPTAEPIRKIKKDRLFS